MSKVSSEYSNKSLVFTKNNEHDTITISAPATAQALVPPTAEDIAAPLLAVENIFAAPVFKEANLPNGSDANPDLLLQPVAIAPGWSIVFDNSWTPGDNDTMIREMGHGKLVASSDGLELSYQLLSPAQHAAPTDNALLDTLEISVISDQDEPILAPVRVLIQDDEPAAHLFPVTSTTIDVNGEIAGECPFPFGADGKGDGIFLFAEVLLPDGKTVVVDCSSSEPNEVVDLNGDNYGLLTIDHETQTFRFKGEKPGEFSIFLCAKDADGDVSKSEPMLVTVKENTSSGILDNLFVDEANLPAGTEPDAAQLTKTVAAPDGHTFIADPDYNWAVDAKGNWTRETPYGLLTVAKDGSEVSYTLLRNADHSTSDLSYQDRPAIQDQINGIWLMDANGREYYLGDNNVTILDDAPWVYSKASEAVIPILAGESFQTSWQIALGADNPNRAISLDVTVNGSDAIHQIPATLGTSVNIVVDNISYGRLKLNGDGTLVFDAGNVPVKLLHIQIALPDDVEGGYGCLMELNIEERPVPPSSWEFAKVTFDEANLPSGLDANAAALTQQLNIPDGFTVNTVRWTDLGNGVFGLPSPDFPEYFKFAYDSSNNLLTCTLLRPVWHSPVDAAEGSTYLSGITLIGANGEVHEAHVPVFILDDTPTVTTLDSTNPPIMVGDIITAQWDVAYGGDGSSVYPGVQVIINFADQQHSTEFIFLPGADPMPVMNGDTLYGWFYLSENYHFEFQTTEHSVGEISFTLNVMDGDMDISGATFTKTVLSETPPPPVPSWEFEMLSFKEANLPGGSGENQELVIKTVPLPDGFTVDTANWTALGAGVFELFPQETPEHLKFTYDGTKLTCTLLAPAWNGGVETAETYLSNPFTLIDADGNKYQTFMPVSATDDAPVLSLAPEADSVVAGETFIVKYALSYGADGKPNFTGLDVKVEFADMGYTAALGFLPYDEPVLLADDSTQYGWLSLFNGELHFAPSPGCLGSVNFTLNAMDADMSVTAAEATVNVLPLLVHTEAANVAAPIAPPPNILTAVWEFGKITFDEGLLLDTFGNVNALTQSIKMPQGFTVNTMNWTELGNGVYEMLSQELPDHIKFTYNGKELSCSLLAPVWHGGLDVAEVYLNPLHLMDANGTAYNAYLPLSILDDAPELSLTYGGNQVLTKYGETFIGKYDLSYGADGAPNFPGIDMTINFAQMEYSVTINNMPTNEAILISNGDTPYGWLALFDGEFHFVHMRCWGDVTFSVSATDSDLDTTTQSISMTIPRIANITQEPVESPLGVVLVDPEPVAPATPWEFAKVTFNEGQLLDAEGHITPLTQTLDLPQGFTVNTANWTDLGNGVYEMYSKEIPDHIKFTYDGKELSCSLLAPAWHGNLDVAEIYLNPLHLMDANGNAYNAYLPLNILDDAPALSLAHGNLEAVTYGQTFIGKYDLNYGADGAPNFPGIDMTINFADMQYSVDVNNIAQNEPILIATADREYGWLALFDGEFHFAPAKRTWGSVEFTVKATDSDLDTSSESINLMVHRLLQSPSTPDVELSSLDLKALVGTDDSLDAYLGGKAGSSDEQATASVGDPYDAPPVVVCTFDSATDDLQQASLSQLLFTLSN